MLRLVSLKDFQMSYYRADLPIRCKIYSSGVIFEGGGVKDHLSPHVLVQIYFLKCVVVKD